MSSTSIEWTEATWNPLTGCTKVSAGCKHCYAERMARRLTGMQHPRYANGFHMTLHEDALEIPLHWKKPRLVFVNSMSDLFHERVPLAFVQRVFAVMQLASQHTFQILTKRSQRLLELSTQLPWPDNVWMGVSVETRRYVHRIDDLRATPAHIRFLSLEPLLGPLPQLDLRGIDWVIVGGESGPGCRPMREQWALDIRDQCQQVGVPFFFKQWGGVRKKQAGRLLDGRLWSDMPKHAAADAPYRQPTPSRHNLGC